MTANVSSERQRPARSRLGRAEVIPSERRTSMDLPMVIALCTDLPDSLDLACSCIGVDTDDGCVPGLGVLSPL